MISRKCKLGKFKNKKIHPNVNRTGIRKKSEPYRGAQNDDMIAQSVAHMPTEFKWLYRLWANRKFFCVSEIRWKKTFIFRRYHRAFYRRPKKNWICVGCICAICMWLTTHRLHQFHFNFFFSRNEFVRKWRKRFKWNVYFTEAQITERKKKEISKSLCTALGMCRVKFDACLCREEIHITHTSHIYRRRRKNEISEMSENM